jgi:NADPH:quinone reductase-like Zn-dependent oxidoreductase
MAITQVTVNGTLKGTGGAAAVGTVAFQLSQQITDGAGTVVSDDPVTVNLSTGGTFSVVLYANDDSTTLPQGTTYKVTFDVNGTVWYQTIVLPHATSPVDISSIVPIGGYPASAPFSYLVSLIEEYAPSGGGGGGSGNAIGGTP